MAIAKPHVWEKVLWPFLALIPSLLLWHYSVKWTHSRVFPSPLRVVQALDELARRGLLVSYIADSLTRVSIGYSLAAALAVPLGLTLGWYPGAAQVVNPLIQMLRPISPIAWIPLSIVWFGVGDAAAVYLIFMASFFPIVVAAMNAVQNMPPLFCRAARNFGLSPSRTLSTVIFPAALPQILIGLRVALGIAWLVVVAAEMIAIGSGLGYLVIDARNSGSRYDLVVAAMFLIGGIGLTLDTGIRRLERLRFVRWGFRHD
jgi:NitT/TauT family transport system permease protein